MTSKNTGVQSSSNFLHKSFHLFQIIAETRNAYRVLETSHPPTYYLPPSDVQAGYLSKAKGRLCRAASVPH